MIQEISFYKFKQFKNPGKKYLKKSAITKIQEKRCQKFKIKLLKIQENLHKFFFTFKIIYIKLNMLQPCQKKFPTQNPPQGHFTHSLESTRKIRWKKNEGTKSGEKSFVCFWIVFKLPKRAQKKCQKPSRRNNQEQKNHHQIKMNNRRVCKEIKKISEHNPFFVCAGAVALKIHTVAWTQWDIRLFFGSRRKSNYERHSWKRARRSSKPHSHSPRHKLRTFNCCNNFMRSLDFTVVSRDYHHR